MNSYIPRQLLFVCVVVALGKTAVADPFGIEYRVLLDGFVTDSVEVELEGHNGNVPFDGLPDMVPNDFNPADLSPTFSDGNDLIVTEDVMGDEVWIWIEGQQPGEPFPTPGAPLFANPLVPVSEVVGFDIFELHWQSDMPAVISNISLELTFGEVSVPITPLAFFPDGDGTSGNAIALQFQLDPLDFSDPLLGDATDLHLHFTVVHIPEPSTLALLVLGALLIFVRPSLR